jgi:hypothetical protein
MHFRPQGQGGRGVGGGGGGVTWGGGVCEYERCYRCVYCLLLTHFITTTRGTRARYSAARPNARSMMLTMSLSLGDGRRSSTPLPVWYLNSARCENRLFTITCTMEANRQGGQQQRQHDDDGGMDAAARGRAERARRFAARVDRKAKRFRRQAASPRAAAAVEENDRDEVKAEARAAEQDGRMVDLTDEAEEVD